MDVSVGKGYVEIKPAGVDKGVIVSLMLQHLAQQGGGVDFVLCVGDDSSDEKMFEALGARLGGSAPSPTTPPRPPVHAHAHVFCATVGRKPSAAPFYVNDHEEVLELLQSLRLHSTRSNRNRSLTDLNRLAAGGGQRTHAGRAPPNGHSAQLGGGADGALGAACARAELGPPIGAALPHGGARTAGALPSACGLYGGRTCWGLTRSNDALPSYPSGSHHQPRRQAQVSAGRQPPRPPARRARARRGPAARPL